MLQRSGWQTGRDRVERIWRREGLKVPQKQRPPRQLWLHDGSCIRLRPERANSVWSYDFVNAWTHEGRLLRTLALIDESTRECLTLRVARRLNSQEVIETLSEVMLWRGIPEHIRSDNGPEFVARQLRDWLRGLGMTRPIFCTNHRERVYITAWGCEIGSGGRNGLQAPGSTKRVLTTRRAIADRKPLVQQRAAQSVEHGRDSNYRQETVRKFAHQAG